MPSPRLDTVDKLKGFAIFLVVLGHIVAREPPQDAEWYVSLKDVLYRFHMPLFMFISGVILAYTRKPIASLSDYWGYVKRKFMRLMPAYFLFALIVFAGKLAFAKFMQVDNSVPSLASLFDVVLNPLSSYCAYLWYIYVLFILYALAPLLYYVTRGQLAWALPVAFALQFYDATNWFCISSCLEYSFVFLLGCVAGEKYDSYNALIEKIGPAAAFTFILALALALPLDIPKFALGLLSIPACHAMMELRIGWSKGLLCLATYTFPIYLMNTMFIGVTKGIMLKFTSWDGLNFLWFGAVLLIAGLVGPILAKRWVIRRVPTLDRVIA